MANAVVTIKIMPESPETNLEELEANAKAKILEFSGNEQYKCEVKPVAFGLKSLNISFMMDEQLGSPESLEKDLQEISGVNSVETTDVRRAVG